MINKILFPNILIEWIGNNHYELLLPNNLNLNDYPIEYKNINKMIVLNTNK